MDKNEIKLPQANNDQSCQYMHEMLHRNGRKKLLGEDHLMINAVDTLVSFVTEKLKEIAVSECMTKDNYEDAHERVYLEFMAMMENV